MDRPALLRLVALVAVVLLPASACPPRPPSAADPDRDGLDAAGEAIWASDPLRADTDADGVPDGIEVLHWTDATDPWQKPLHFPTELFARAGILYAASHDASGVWELTAWDAGMFGVQPFARLGRPSGGAGFGLAFDHHGFLYVARGFSLARVHPFTGAVDRGVELRDATGAPVLVLEIAFDLLTLELYGVERTAADAYGHGREIVRIDRANGLVTRTGVVLEAPVHAFAFRPLEPFAHPPFSPSLFAAFDTGLGGDVVAPLTFASPGGVNLSQVTVPWAVTGIALDPFNPTWWALAHGIGPAQGEIWGGSLWSYDAFPRALGAIAAPPPCPAPCYGEAQTLISATDIATGQLADRDADGALDAVVLIAENPWVPQRLEVWRNDSAGALSLASTTPVAASDQPSFFAAFVLADFVGDEALDAAVLVDGGVAIHPGQAGGGFDAETMRLPGQEYALEGSDVTGDGRVDLVVSGSEGLRVLASDGAGSFAEPIVADGSFFPNRLALASRGAGADAIVAMHTAELVVYEPDGSGGYTRSQPLAEIDPYWAAWTDVAAGDLDGDGVDEIVVTRVDVASAVDVFQRNAGGSWDRTQIEMAPDFSYHSVAPRIGDATGDGRADVLVSVRSGGGGDGIVVLVGDGSGALAWSLAPLATLGLWGEGPLALGDVDGNGFADVVRFDWANYAQWLPNATSFPEPD